MMVRTMRFFSRASVVGANQTVLRIDGGSWHSCIMCRDLGLDLRHMCERPVPARLQFARDQPVGWIGSIVLLERAVGGVARRFEVAAEGLAHLISPLARLLLGGCGGGDRAGTDYSQQRILDGVVNT